MALLAMRLCLCTRVRASFFVGMRALSHELLSPHGTAREEEVSYDAFTRLPLSFCETMAGALDAVELCRSRPYPPPPAFGSHRTNPRSLASPAPSAQTDRHTGQFSTFANADAEPGNQGEAHHLIVPPSQNYNPSPLPLSPALPHSLPCLQVVCMMCAGEHMQLCSA